MPTWDEFERGLKAASRETAHLRMPEAPSRRIRARLADAMSGKAKPARARPVRWLTACAAAALAVSAIVLWHSYRAEPRRLAGWLVTEASANLGAAVGEDGVVEIRTGGCILTDETWGGSLRPEGNTRLKREGNAIRIVSGTIAVSVKPRAPGARAAEVLVSGGTIQVLGTRFTVAESNGSGQVTLHEGHIRFVPTDRTVAAVNLAPGESLKWPLASAPETAAPASTMPNDATAPVAPEPSKALQPTPTPPSSASARSVETLLERVAVLRSRGQYRQAAEELAKALPPVGAPGSESASYELGSILTYQLADRERGCAHWHRHERRFPAGAFAVEVQRAEQKLGCTMTTNKERP